MANNKLFDILFGHFKQYAKLSVQVKLFFKLFDFFFGSAWLMKLVHTLQSRHLAHLDGLRLLWIVSGAQKSPKTSRKREWVDVQVNGVSESRIATPSTRAHVSQ